MKKNLLLTIYILLASAVAAFSHGRAVTGVVFDDQNGETVIGASVIAVDAKGKVLTGVSTDVSGTFSMNLPESTAELRVSCIGYDDVVLVPAGTANSKSI
jgi:hypothetical protein